MGGSKSKQRSDRDLQRAFQRHIPEVAAGTIKLKKIVREPGWMAYVALAKAPRAKLVDPVGLCAGERGARLKAVCKDLEGEVVNLVAWHKEPKLYARNALGLARADLAFKPGFRVDKPDRQIFVIVNRKTRDHFCKRDPLRLRLISELIGWNITLLRGDAL